MPETEEQRKGRIKAAQIDRSYIESGDFRRKFDQITDSPKLNRLLCQLSKKMLYHRSGTLFEDMYWIDLDTETVVAWETDEEEIRYSDATIHAIQRHPHLLTIHSHPGSFPPSISDLLSNYKHNYSIGIVVCHNGTVYLYSAVEEPVESYYNLKIADFRSRGYNELEAQLLTLDMLAKNDNIVFKEVTNHGL